MERAQRDGHNLRSGLIGFSLALVLTGIAFALVILQALPRTQTLIVISVAAVVQVFVHLHYFLGLDLKRTPRENVLALAFTGLLIFLMIGGTVWITANLAQNTAY